MSEPGPGPASAGQPAGESTGTVVVAGLANLSVAVAKAVAGVISHSSAMLSEAAHSVADTVTQVLLFVALKRGDRPADARHPLGYGRETYFWAFLAALTTFVVGAGFSVYQGVTTIVDRREGGDPLVSYLVLAVAVVLEGASLLKAVHQVRGAARRWRISPLRYLRLTSDTTVKAVTFEDSAALAGLVLAALGLFLEQVTGDPLWDGVAAMLIGLLLLVVAITLARANVSLLIGQSAPAGIEEDLRAEIAALDHVCGISLLVTSVIGPGELIVAAKVDFDDGASVPDIERIADEAERRLVARHQGVRYVFLDPTATPAGTRPRTPSPGPPGMAAEG